MLKTCLRDIAPFIRLGHYGYYGANSKSLAHRKSSSISVSLRSKSKSQLLSSCWMVRVISVPVKL